MNVYADTYSRTVTVLIRDDSPMIHCGDNPVYRTASFDLTNDQMGQIRIRQHEEISRLILEPVRKSEK